MHMTPLPNHPHFRNHTVPPHYSTSPTFDSHVPSTPGDAPCVPVRMTQSQVLVVHCSPLSPPLSLHINTEISDLVLHSEGLCEVAIPWETLEDPQRVRKISPVTDLYCGRCLTWVQTNSKTIRTARPNFAAHQKTIACRKRWDLLHEHLNLVRSGSPVLQLPSPSEPRLHPGCPGVLLDWPVDHALFLEYPFHRHDLNHRHPLPWHMYMWDAKNKVMSIRSKSCSASAGVDGRVCAACDGVEKIANAKICSVLKGQEVLSTTSYDHRNWLTLRGTAVHSRAGRARAQQDVCTHSFLYNHSQS
jgi:hypothetical protein